MKQLKSSILNSLRKGMMLAAAAFTCTAAFAAEPVEMGNENRVIELGVEYLIPDLKASSGVYTSPKASRLYMDGAQDFRPFKDAAHTQECLTQNLDNTGHMCWMDVEENQTIYFFTDFAFNRNIFTLYQEGVLEKPLEISLIQPDPGEVVDFNNYGDLTVTFNQDIKLADGNQAYITFRNRLTDAQEKIDVRTSASGQTLIVNMYTPLKPYMASGAILTGDEYSVTVPGLTSLTGVPYAEADADGNAVFTFRCGSLPVVATQEYCPNPFLSYWAPGAPEGILTMEFDAPLMDDGLTTVELGWGNSEGGDGEYYAESVVCKIDGNKLSADFTGKLRTPATMTPGFPDARYSVILLKLVNVRDDKGVPVASPGSGTIGSYSFMPAYKLIERTSVVSEFSPATGSLLTDVDNINVWLSGLSSIEFDGFNIAWTDAEGNVSDYFMPLTDVKVSNNDGNEAEYDFTLPADIKANAKRVEITLAHLKSIDGYDHSNEVRCIYGGFTVLYSEPANGEELAMLAEDSKIYVETNLSEQYPSLYIRYEILDANPEDENPVVKSAAWMTRNADGSYEATIPQTLKLYAGHDYKVNFTAWENESIYNHTPEEKLGSDFIVIKGTTPAYLYATDQLRAITPAVGEVIGDDVTGVVLEFTGLVSLGKYTGAESDLRTFINVGQGERMAFKEVVPVQPLDVDGVTVSNEWHLVLPDGYVASLTSPLEISFTVYNQDGLLLKGNQGNEETTYFQYSWNVENQYAEANIEIEGNAPYTSVTEFLASNNKGINIDWNMQPSQAYVTLNGEIVTRVEDVTFTAVELGEVITEVKLELEKEINLDGTYHLIIPEGYFVIGTDDDIYTSKPIDFEFKIEGGMGAVEDIFATDKRVTVYNAAGIRLLENAEPSALRTLAPGLYIVNGQKVMVK